IYQMHEIIGGNMNKRLSLRRSDGSGSATERGPALKILGRLLIAIVAMTGLLYTPALRAQTTAQLTGTVEDPSGGVIPGAQVTLLNQATHDTRVAVTNSVGLY